MMEIKAFILIDVMVILKPGQLTTLLTQVMITIILHKQFTIKPSSQKCFFFGTVTSGCHSKNNAKYKYCACCPSGQSSHLYTDIALISMTLKHFDVKLP